MIPQFPNFKPIAWEDRLEIEAHASHFATYSDFNFTSMYAWNVFEQMQIAKLHENLVVLFNDYITGIPFLSFMGTQNATETTKVLLEYSMFTYNTDRLKLIPETVANSLCDDTLAITADRDAFDYVFPVAFLASLNIQPAKCKPANQLRHFLKEYPHYECAYVSLRDADKTELLDIFKDWASNKNLNYRMEHEYKAFERLVLSAHDNLQITLIAINEITCACMINEIVSTDTATCHFAKADVAYKGIYDALLWLSAQRLQSSGIKHFNLEQDLGIENLRKAKEKYREFSFLKKYTVEKKETVEIP